MVLPIKRTDNLNSKRFCEHVILMNWLRESGDACGHLDEHYMLSSSIGRQALSIIQGG
jgi:hypothetical protein